MPPKGRKRRTAEVSEEEQRLYDELEGLLYKYRYEDESQEAGMFGEEAPKIHIDSIPEMCQELDLQWDSSVLAILKPQEKVIDFSMLKLLIRLLMTVKDQESDIEYLFKTFSGNGDVITTGSLAQALKHLNFRESGEKINLLFAFAHEQPFLNLILNEQMHGEAAARFADVRGVSFLEFKRTFIRSTYLANSQ